MSNNLDFQKQFLDATSEEGRDIADAVGMPDNVDYEVLLKIIQKFERRHPGLINYCIQMGRRDYELGVHKKKQIFDKSGKAVISKDSNMHYVFELPGDLVSAIEKVFPTMFRSPKHFRWFKKNFSKLTITGTDK